MQRDVSSGKHFGQPLFVSGSISTGILGKVGAPKFEFTNGPLCFGKGV